MEEWIFKARIGIMSGMAIIESDAISEEVLALIRPNFKAVKVPTTYDKVYKDECMFSFDT